MAKRDASSSRERKPTSAAAPHSATGAAVVAIVSSERFLRREALCALVEKLTVDGSEQGTTSFDGDPRETALSDVLDTLRTPSLFGGRITVIVDEADPFITAHREALERYCRQPVEHAVLVLVCKSLPSNTRLHKAIAAIGGLVEVAPPNRGAGASWARQRCEHEYGKRLDPAAAELLSEHVGDDLGVLDAELAKLATYVGTRATIAVQDVEAMVEPSRTEVVFKVYDALVRGDAPRALTLWERVLETDRSAPHRALGGFVWAVRNMLAARRMAGEGAALPTIAYRVLRCHPDEARLRLGAYSDDQLEGQLRDLCEIDAASKIGLCTVEAAIERFIITHAAVPGRVA
jgi:DNA polymerase-3 subunit delta